MRLSSLLFLPFFLVACTPKGTLLKKLVVVETLGQSYLATDFSNKLTKKLKNLDAATAKDPNIVRKAKNELINSFILEAMVKDYAKTHSLSISQQEIDAEINLVRASYPNDLAFKESLAHADLLVSEWRASLTQTLLLKKVMQHLYTNTKEKKTIDVADQKNYYLANPREFNRANEVRIAQIVLKTQEEAQKLLKTIKSGALSFEVAAKKFSLSPDGKNGGDIGYMVKGVVPVFDTAFNMSVNQLSPVLKSPYGFHIVKVTAKRPATKISFEQARPIIIKLLEESAKSKMFDEWYSEKIKSIKIKKDEALINNIKVETEGSFE